MRPAKVARSAEFSPLGNIYALRDGRSHYKIGYTENVGKRIAAFNASRADAVIFLFAVPGTIQQEGAIHRLLAPFRFRGEWYSSDAIVIRNALYVLRHHGAEILLGQQLDALEAYMPFGDELTPSVAALQFKMLAGASAEFPWWRSGVPARRLQRS